MRDPRLALLWEMCDRDDAIITGHDVSTWPGQIGDALVDAGHLSRSGRSKYATCTECFEPHEEEIDWEIIGDKTMGVIHCPDAGRVDVTEESTLHWKVHTEAIRIAIRKQLKIPGEDDELIAGHLWQIGWLKYGTVSGMVLFGRGLGALDSLQKIAVASSSLLLVPRQVPRVELWEHNVPHCLQLDQISTWSSRSGVRFDAQRVYDLLERDTTCVGADTDRIDGFYAPRTIVWRGRTHDCDGLTKQQMGFLVVGLQQDEIDVKQLMHSGSRSIWKETYASTVQQRQAISQLLSRVNAALRKAEPKLAMTFNLRSKTDFISRQSR